jgi:hypothetical protein
MSQIQQWDMSGTFAQMVTQPDGEYVTYTDHQQREQELKAECNRLGQGQVMLADEVAELEAENTRLKAERAVAMEVLVRIGTPEQVHEAAAAILASRATAKEKS